MPRTVIEEDLTVLGNIRSESGDVSIKGRVTGDIMARRVGIELTGDVKGAISAQEVTVHGKQSGRIKCTELSLEKTAVVKSDVTADTLSSEKGARLAGKIQIGGQGSGG